MNNNVNYVDSFGVEHILKEIKIFIGNESIRTNIFRVQAYDSVMCSYFCIRFIDFMLKGKSLTDFTNLFSRNDFKKNDEIILNYFLKWFKISSMKQCYCLKCKNNTGSINPKDLKTNDGKTMLLSKCVIYGTKKSRLIKEHEAKEILSSLGLKTPLSKIPLLNDLLF